MANTSQFPIDSVEPGFIVPGLMFTSSEPKKNDEKKERRWPWHASLPALSVLSRYPNPTNYSTSR